MEYKDYVSCEVAKKLKEKGYPQVYERNGYMYADKGSDMLSMLSDVIAYFSADYKCVAPTLYDAQKWLREEHDIDVLVSKDLEVDDYDNLTGKVLGYSFDIYKGNKYVSFCMNYHTYQGALNGGIERALEYLDKN